MEFYERVSGARMHAAYVRPGGVDRVSFLSTQTNDDLNEMIIQKHKMMVYVHGICLEYYIGQLSSVLYMEFKCSKTKM